MELDINLLRKTFIEAIIMGVKIRFKKDGYIQSIGILLYKDGTHKFISPPIPNGVDVLKDPHNYMEFYYKSLKEICHKTKPIAIAVISESYAVDNDDLTKEDLEDMIRENGGSLEGLPGIKDLAVINFETTLTREAITFEIDRQKKTLTNQKRSSEVTGFFTGILNNINYN